jgi:hypothetical protein
MAITSRVLLDMRPISRPAIGIPDEQQMAKIAALLPYGSEDPKPKDFRYVTFVASDNFVNRDLMAWSLGCLQGMAASSYGKSLLMDHDWWDCEDVQGVIFDSRIVRYADAPSEVIDAIGQRDCNLSQMRRDSGYITLEIDVFFPSDSKTLEYIASGVYQNCSTGGIRITPSGALSGLICPLCNVSFSDPSCPHTIPIPYESHPDPAPYAIKDGFTELIELSVVVLGNLPNAGVLR